MSTVSDQSVEASAGQPEAKPQVKQEAMQIVKTASTVLLIRSNILKDVENLSVWPQGSRAPSSLVDLARQATKEGRSIQRIRYSRSSQTSTTLIAVPLSNRTGSQTHAQGNAGLIGAIAMAMPTPNPEISKRDPAVGAITSLSMFNQDRIDQRIIQSNRQKGEKEKGEREKGERALVDAKRTAELAEKERAGNASAKQRAGMVLQLLSTIHRHGKFESAASEFVSELAASIGANRVSLGFVKDGHSKLTAISNVAALKNSAIASRDLALAMDEALDQASTVAYPQAKGADPRVTLAHERFCQKHESPNIVTVPIVIEEDSERCLVGAITAEYAEAKSLNQVNTELLEQLATVLGPALDTKRRAEASLSSRMQRGFKGKGISLIAKSNYKPIVALAATLVLIAICLIPIEHRVTATARIEGSTQRVMAAAVDGYIGAVHARPGVRVKKGQALIDLDDRDLQLERRKLESEYAQIEKKYGEALVKEDQAQIAIQQAKLAQIRSQVAIVDDQLGRIKITSPFEAVILSGDQTQSLGAPVKRGDVLMTLAPMDQYRLVIEVDERDIALLQIKQSGQLVLGAIPDQTFKIEVARVTPIALVKDGLNIFEVEAKIASEKALIQPGLEGVAKIDTGSRALIAVLTNRLRQWLNISLWKWKL